MVNSDQPLAEGGNVEVYSLGKALQRRTSDDDFVGNGVALRPHDCAIGPAGRKAVAVLDSANGVWKGCVQVSQDQNATSSAASSVATLLTGTVRLDCCGTLATHELPFGSLGFVPSRFDEEDALPAQIIGSSSGDGSVQAFCLVGHKGCVLSHEVVLWLCKKAVGSFEAVLKLEPRKWAATEVGGGRRMCIARPVPMGQMREVWSEVPTIQFPRLLRIMLESSKSNDERGFLVEEKEEIIVFHVWQRLEADECIEACKGECALTIEQLLWLNVVEALGEMDPCDEAPVPAPRIRLVDEGVANCAELMDEDTKKITAFSGVPRENAPRLASLSFLRQYVPQDVLRDELLPKLFPQGATSGSTIRVFSAQLEDEQEDAKSVDAPKPDTSVPAPRTLDDLFDDDADFRIPPPWEPASGVEDALRGHELSSIILLNERSGFFSAFHCLHMPEFTM